MDVFLEVLDEDSRFSFQQKIEPVPGPVDFQKPVDDEDDENDSGKNPQIDEGEASLYLVLILGQNRAFPISLWVIPAEERSF